LVEHSKQFRPQVITVVPGVHVAVGFGLANSILIEGDDGVIIVDTLESNTNARIVKQKFNTISNKPVKAIISTHNHAGHIFGATGMAGDDHPEVISHATTPALIAKIMSLLRPVISRRSLRPFGVHIDPKTRLNCGIGPSLVLDDVSDTLWPTRTYEDTLKLTIAGVEMELFHAPGETPDHTCIWLPQHKLLIPGDNFYWTFPNLYAIRGTAYRDVMAWVRSLDLIRSYGAEHLVPCHGRPMHGTDAIESALTDYRDAIQYVHDATLRGLNAGLSIDDVVASVQLPPPLCDNPALL